MEANSSDCSESLAREHGRLPRVCLGPNAPAEMADFISRAGIEVLPFANKHRATMYVDFVGARPAGVEVVSIDLVVQGLARAAHSADLATDQWQTAACMVISQALAPQATLADRRSRDARCDPQRDGRGGEPGAGHPQRRDRLRQVQHRAHHSQREPLQRTLAHHQLREPAGCRCGKSHRHPAGSRRVTVASVLFLDEIAELTDAAQLKLLQMLQRWSALRCFEERERGAAMRFVAATNRALAALVERGDFRRELFWRLNVFSLAIPPLRQRAGDVAILAKLFLRRANPRRMFTPMALRVMSSYAFPGNVMELENLGDPARNRAARDRQQSDRCARRAPPSDGAADRG